MIGQTIQQYKIVESLGAGGMGEVFLAEDVKLQRKVALKFLPEQFSGDSEFKSRFEHEARAAAALNHPNIITVHDIGEHEGRMYIVMEYVTGRTLAELIDSKDVSIRKALELGAQICDGLDAAHNAGIVHRDIKPANIQIDDRGRARILDFGLAKSQRATTETKVGSTLGTVMYESPEQSRGEVVDQRSDLFSFGTVMYEMITGTLPFPGDYDQAIRYAISHQTVEPLERYKKDVPPGLEQLISKLLEKEADMRYQTASDVLVDLKRIQRDLTQTTAGVERIVPAAEGGKSDEAPMVSAAKKAGPKKFVFPAAIVVVLLALTLVLKPWKIEVAPTQEAQAMEDRLAIMYFNNIADPNDTQRQAEIVTNLLITDISASTQLKVISSQRLYDILKQLGREGEKIIDRGVATQIAKKAQAKWMLTGNILRTEPNVILTAQLIEVETGIVLTSTRIDGAEDEDIFSLVDKLTDEMTQDLAATDAIVKISLNVADLTTTSPDAYRHYLEGQEKFYQYQFYEASKAFERAIAADSNFALAYFMRSVSGDNGRAYIQKAKERAGNVPEFLRMAIFAQEAVLQDSVIKAIRLFEDIAAKYPDEKGFYTYLGVLYARWPVRDLRSSVRNLLKAIEMDPFDRMAYNTLAHRYHSLGDADSSIWAINEYIKLAPDEPNPYDTRAALHGLNGQLDLAIEYYQKALEIDPEYGNSMRKLAYLHLYSGNITEASRLMGERASHIDKYVRINGRAGLKNISLFQGKLLEAFDRYEHFFENHRIEINKGQIPRWHYIQRKDFALLLHELTGEQQWADSASRALDSYDSMVVNDTSSTQSQKARIEQTTSIRALTWLKLGEVERADSIFKTLPARNTDTSDAGSLAAYRWREFERTFYHGDYDSAAYFANLVVDIVPSFRNYIHSGRTLLLAGKIGEAVAALERAEKTYDRSRNQNVTQSVRVHYWLGQAYEASGWNDKAIFQYETFLEIWKNADENIMGVKDARKRLANLGV